MSVIRINDQWRVPVGYPLPEERTASCFKLVFRRRVEASTAVACGSLAVLAGHGPQFFWTSFAAWWL